MSLGRVAASDGDVLLVLDKIGGVGAAAAAGAKEAEVRRTVAVFVRGEGTRTPGGSTCSAGGGGRLMVDLSLWDEREKDKREMVVVLAVTTLLVMLKREVDRRRALQIGIIGSVVGARAC